MFKAAANQGMASIAGLYGGYTANQEDGSGGRTGFFRGWRSDQKGRGGPGGGGGRGGTGDGNTGRSGDGGPGGGPEQDLRGCQQQQPQQNSNFNEE